MILLFVCRSGAPVLLTASDDGTAKLWDPRQKQSTAMFDRRFAVTSVALSPDASLVVAGGIDNQLGVYDTRKGNELVYSLAGHGDSLTCARFSPDGSYLLTNAMDNTVRIWDMRPYAPQERCLKVFGGAQHNFEKNLIKCNWSADGQRVAAGSSARFVYVWDTTSRQILYRLPGHAGSVNEVDFHPTEPIIGSGGSDKRAYLGEL
jgi:Prp8 binding protein